MVNMMLYKPSVLKESLSKIVEIIKPVFLINPQIIHQSKKLLDKLYAIIKDLDNTNQDDEIQSNIDAIGPLMDDLNTPGLIAELNNCLLYTSPSPRD